MQLTSGKKFGVYVLKILLCEWVVENEYVKKKKEEKKRKKEFENNGRQTRANITCKHKTFPSFLTTHFLK